MANSLDDWQQAVHGLAREKGWWGAKSGLEIEAARKLAVIALLHCNLSYELENIRKGSSVKPNRITRKEAEEIVQFMHGDRVLILSNLALIHSEVTEAVESILPDSEWCADFEQQSGKGGKPEGLVSEMADIVIRCLDLAGGFSLRLGAAIRDKHKFNKSRSHKHGGKLA